MASESENSLDPQGFQGGYLRQPYWNLLSSQLAISSDQPLDSLPEAQLANLFSAGAIEQGAFNDIPYAHAGVQVQGSSWTQIPTIYSRTDQAPLDSHINPVSQTSQQFDIQDSSSDYACGLPYIPEHTTMNEVPYLHQLANTMDVQMASHSDALFPRDFQPVFTSMSPSSASVSMGAGTPSPHTGTEAAAYTNFSSTFPSNGMTTLDLEEEDLSNEPYAKLIFRALMSAPGQRMILREIYDWFEVNTDKAGDPKSRGWQNSIRHNLSMNGAFRKEEQLAPSEDGRRNFVWVLEKAAIEAGEVQSTTRYRRPAGSKRIAKSDSTFSRQRCGAKGSRASRAKQNGNRNSETNLNHPFFARSGLPSKPLEAEMKSGEDGGYDVGCYVETFTGIEHALPQSPEIFSPQSATGQVVSRLSPFGPESLVPHISPTPTLTSTSHTEPDNYDLDNIVGCTEYDGLPLFCLDREEQLTNNGTAFCESNWSSYPTLPSGLVTLEELSLRN